MNGGSGSELLVQSNSKKKDRLRGKVVAKAAGGRCYSKLTEFLESAADCA